MFRPENSQGINYRMKKLSRDFDPFTKRLRAAAVIVITRSAIDRQGPCVQK
jgi:hypothetical protein